LDRRRRKIFSPVARAYRGWPSRHRSRRNRISPARGSAGVDRRRGSTHHGPRERRARSDRGRAAGCGWFAMLTRITGGGVIDPANARDGVGDVWMRDGRISVSPPVGTQPDETYDATGKIVMAGAIDIHSHIAGANVNTARLLLPEWHRAAATRPAA